MKYQLRNTANRSRTALEDLEAPKTETREVIELDDAMLRRVAGGAAPNTCTLCEDVDC